MDSSNSEAGASEDEIIHALKAATQHAFYLEHPTIRSSRPDVVGISIDPSLEIHGYEVKRSRQDWLSELRSGKNSNSRDACDYWWIVALPKVVLPDDLPPFWGLKIIQSDRSFHTFQAASALPSRALDRDLVRTIFSLIIERTPKTKWTMTAYEDGFKDAMKEILDYHFSKDRSPHYIRELLKALDTRASFKELKALTDLQNAAATIKERIDSAVSSLPSYTDWETGQPMPPIAEHLKALVEQEFLNKWPGMKDDPNLKSIVEYAARRRFL